jgi:hypothetical protein
LAKFCFPLDTTVLFDENRALFALSPDAGFILVAWVDDPSQERGGELNDVDLQRIGEIVYLDLNMLTLQRLDETTELRPYSADFLETTSQVQWANSYASQPIEAICGVFLTSLERIVYCAIVNSNSDPAVAYDTFSAFIRDFTLN